MDQQTEPEHSSQHIPFLSYPFGFLCPLIRNHALAHPPVPIGAERTTIVMCDCWHAIDHVSNTIGLRLLANESIFLG